MILISQPLTIFNTDYIKAINIISNFNYNNFISSNTSISSIQNFDNNNIEN